MNEWIKWKQSNEFDTQYGEMNVKDINKCLEEFRNLAKAYMNKTNCQHVVYTVEEFDENENIKEIHFYENMGMDDKTFDERTRLIKGKVYAIHKR